MLRRLVPLLIPLAAAASEHLVIEAPGSSTQLTAGGVVTIAGSGFVARRGEWLLTGDALRWDQRGDRLWASGGIVLVMPAVRLHADRIGMRPGARTGDAWGVRAWITRGSMQVRVEAERVELRPDRLTFHGVRTDFGHGGVLALSCPRLHIHLREEQRTDKGAEQLARYVEGIEAIRPTVWVAGAPVLWFPYLYRDFIFDYPWSTVEVGRSARLGDFLRYQVGSNLPEAAGWRTRLEARADRHTRAGNGFGLSAYWRHRTWGRGEAAVYRMDRERVADPADEATQGGIRGVEAWDAEHHVSGVGWALAGRYTVLPGPDPSTTLAADRSPDERFRADHLREALEEKPFARRGVSGAWVLPWLAVVGDGEGRPNRLLDETERLYGADVLVPRLAVAGPVAVDARLRAERLRQEVQDTGAARLSWQGRLSVVRWLNGVGLDAAAGARGTAWGDGRLAGVEIEGTRGLTLPFGEGGVRLRLHHPGGEEGVSASLVPRLGVELLGPGRGAGNPGFAFGDGVDDPETDRRYWVTGLDAELSAGAGRFRAEVVARWAMRDLDREAVEVDGGVRSSPSPLAEVVFRLRGSPSLAVEALADGRWDARLARWTSFDARARWRLAERLDLLYNGAYVPPRPTASDAWLHRGGASLYLSRYRLDSWGEVRPGGDDRPGGRGVDLWHLGFTRRMVDGQLSVGYENDSDAFTGEIDHRFSATFTIGGEGRDASDPVKRAFGF